VHISQEPARKPMGGVEVRQDDLVETFPVRGPCRAPTRRTLYGTIRGLSGVLGRRREVVCHVARLPRERTGHHGQSPHRTRTAPIQALQ
jgi:hypothetical protein